MFIIASIIALMSACPDAGKPGPVDAADDTDDGDAIRVPCGEDGNSIDMSGLIPVEVLTCCGDYCRPTVYTIEGPENGLFVRCNCDPGEGLVVVYYSEG